MVLILKQNLIKKIQLQQEMTGLFFTIEGTDGSGKATQTKLLEEALRKKGYDVLHQEFPRYGHEAAYLTEQYLGSVYGKQPAKRSSVFYTVDRFDAYQTVMKPHLAKGGVVVSDRWVESSKGHQAGKATTEEERQAIIKYINELEYEIMGLPKPTKTIFINMHPITGQRLTGINKNAKVEGKDLHEQDVDHLLNARNAFIKVAQEENWIIINPMRKDQEDYSKEELINEPIETLLKTPQEIHEDIIKKIETYLV